MKKQFASVQEFEEAFNQIRLIKLFTFDVLNKRTNEIGFIDFNIFVDCGQLKAHHEALTELEQKSEKIACKYVDIDTDFSIDDNLQALFYECLSAINNSDFFTLN